MTERERFLAWWDTEGSRQQADTHDERAWLTWKHLTDSRPQPAAIPLDYAP